MHGSVKAALLTLAMLVVVAPANAQAAAYTACQKAGDAKIVDVSGATCDEARAVAAALAGVAPANVEAVLRAQGWAPLRAAATGYDESYDLFATRGRAALFLRRGGAAPNLDGWTAGRELVFSRLPLVGGATVPQGSAACTSGFLIRLGRRLGGLSAGHCAGLTRKRTTLRRNGALRETRQVGLVVGGVRRNLWRKRRGRDALVLPAPSGPGRSATPVVDRGILAPPLFVAGSARPQLGRRVCLTGRSSGIDQCGRIIRSYPGTGGIPCTTISASGGDSGSPVYTAPRADGTVRAVGIAVLVFGPFQSMCFEPIGPVLRGLDATLVTQ
ncbi:MAG: S1 family peptidase [Actinobacteria bacterium]|nr:S1 family peptidase [Actinomycetota bacterium]